MGKIKAGLFYFVLVVVLTGCIKIPIGDGNSLKLSKDGLTVSDSAGKESTLNIDKDDESFSLLIDGENEWEGSFGENVALPEAFPVADFPIPEEANIISAQKMTLEEGEGSIVMYMYEGDIESLTKIYVDHFNSNGFEEVEEASLGELVDTGFMTIGAKKNNKIYMVQMIEDGGNIQVTLMYGENNE